MPDDLKAQERGQWQWRLGCMGRPLAGAALEESAEELKGIANFEGAASACLLTTAVVPYLSCLVQQAIEYLRCEKTGRGMSLKQPMLSWCQLMILQL